MALPDAVMLRDREIPIEYDVEESDGVKTGVARLVLPEKIGRNLTDAELPELDRPRRFVVPRGQRGAARAATLDELQDLLDQPWTADEIARLEQQRTRERQERKREFGERKARGDLRRGRAGEERKGGGKRGGRGRSDVNPRRRREGR